MSPRIPDGNPLKNLAKPAQKIPDTGVQAAERLGKKTEDVKDKVSGGVSEAKDAFEEATAGSAAKSAEAVRAPGIRAEAWLQDVQRIAVTASWEDLVVPKPQLQTLQHIANAVRDGRTRATPVHVTALFSGEDGTGKTLAAEVLAKDLDLPLYRIDLADVVHKYIGETEKNLSGVFDAAGQNESILFFHEADVLFGQRTEVKDGHDRYANIETNYLLQRIEEHSGVVVLASNLENSLDEVSVRHQRFDVAFPFPDADARARIWSLLIDKQAVAGELDVGELAAWPLTGGRIREVVARGAALAAEEGGAVHMRHFRQAVRAELTDWRAG
jgi:SpoVK/Ycf46/Vps4 family AAA+-type ATPase